jgi:hypothetical protein
MTDAAPSPERLVDGIALDPLKSTAASAGLAEAQEIEYKQRLVETLPCASVQLPALDVDLKGGSGAMAARARRLSSATWVSAAGAIAPNAAELPQRLGGDG